MSSPSIFTGRNKYALYKASSVIYGSIEGNGCDCFTLIFIKPIQTGQFDAF